ncbi:hypothetical protein AKO1_013107 [Acrasis kona]|uniref:RRM domain-containing protein n=1 Tax=Acrasis kona TaxID=1008807 RepID=A0AAW2ZHN9_9EUKA
MAQDARSNLYVGRIPQEWSRETLMDLFSGFGPISSLTKLPFRDYGLIRYASYISADKAIKAMNGREFEDKKIIVKVADNPAKDAQRNYNNNYNQDAYNLDSYSHNSSLENKRDSPYLDSREYRLKLKDLRSKEIDGRRSPIDVVENAFFAELQKQKTDANPQVQENNLSDDFGSSYINAVLDDYISLK